MRIKSIEFENIRCFSSLAVDLDRDVTLLYGTNGAGKSTIITGLAAALAVMPGVGAQLPFEERDLRVDTTGAGGPFRRERARAGEVRVTLRLGATERTFGLGLALERGKLPVPTGAYETFQSTIQARVEKPRSTLPVLAIYSAQRSWRDAQHRDPLPPGRLAGYQGALVAGTDVAHLRAWWRDQDHRRKSDRKTPTLDVVEEAVQRFLGEEVELPGYSLDEEDIVIDMPETRARLCLRELSDGYRGMIALVVDIARRMAQLNPDAGGGALEHTPGLVAIDELDLHLHPEWQRTVLPRLRAAFPRVQFVLTSHSPQVLASLDSNEEVLGLSLAGEVIHSACVVGRDSNALLADVMGDQIRPERYQKKLDEFYVKIDDGDFARARLILDELEALWGADEPTLLHARWALDDEEP